MGSKLYGKPRQLIDLRVCQPEEKNKNKLKKTKKNTKTEKIKRNKLNNIQIHKKQVSTHLLRVFALGTKKNS